MTAGAEDSKISNQPVTFVSNRNRPIRISNLRRSLHFRPPDPTYKYMAPPLCVHLNPRTKRYKNTKYSFYTMTIYISNV